MIIGFVIVEQPDGTTVVFPVTAEDLTKVMAATEEQLQRELTSMLN